MFSTHGLHTTAAGRVDWRRPSDPRLFGSYLRTEEEWREAVRAVSCPVLVVRAAESEVFTGTADKVAAVFPDGAALEVPDSGHMIMLENVPGWSDAILALLGPEPV